MRFKVLVYTVFVFLARLSIYRLGGFDCYSGVCLRLRVEQPVQAMQPALVTLGVRTARHEPSMAVHLYTEHWATLQGPVTIPEHAQVSDPSSGLGWSLETRRGRTYTFTAYVVFAQPPPSCEGCSVALQAYATTPQGAIVRDSVHFHFDAEGRQVEPSPTPGPMIVVSGTAMTVTPRPTFTPGPTFTPRPTFTRRPTRTPILPTPTPSVTPTHQVYPPPAPAYSQPE